MTDEPGSKRRLGKITLQQRVVSAQALRTGVGETPGESEPAPAVTEQLDAAFSEPPQPLTTDSAAGLADKDVLVVDPQADLVELLHAGLGQNGPGIARCPDAEHALHALHARRPDLLLIDAELPGMPGFELCSRVRQGPAGQALPIVVVSGIHRSWRYAADLRLSFGIEHLFERPVDSTRLCRTLRCALRGEQVSDEPPAVPAAAEALLAEATAAFERGALDEAIACLEGGIRQTPKVFQLQYQLGLLYGHRGDLFWAVRALEAASELHARHFAVLKNLAVVYQRVGFLHKATETWERAMRTAPDQTTRTSIKQHMMRLL